MSLPPMARGLILVCSASERFGIGLMKIAIVDPTGTGAFSSGTKADVTTQVPGTFGEISPSGQVPRAIPRAITKALVKMGLMKRAANVNKDFVCLSLSRPQTLKREKEEERGANACLDSHSKSLSQQAQPAPGPSAANPTSVSSRWRTRTRRGHLGVFSRCRLRVGRGILLLRRWRRRRVGLSLHRWRIVRLLLL